MVLPEPSLTFTIPSIHDNTTLDCRLYLPDAHNAIRRGAIIAHPYASLGGCFDDPIVETAAAEVLKAGCIVGTFNFRYAFAISKSFLYA
jgi:alpha/beta superfamily hydrolase